MDVYLMEFDLSREKAEARVAMGCGFFDVHVPSSACNTLGYPKMGNFWRWPGLAICWRLQRRRVKCVEYPGREEKRRGVTHDWRLLCAPFRNKRSLQPASLLVRRKWEREEGNEMRRKTGRIKPRVERRTSTGFSRRTGGRNRRHAGNGEYHYARHCCIEGTRSSGPSEKQRAVQEPPGRPHFSIGAESS